MCLARRLRDLAGDSPEVMEFADGGDLQHLLKLQADLGKLFEVP